MLGPPGTSPGTISWGVPSAVGSSTKVIDRRSPPVGLPLLDLAAQPELATALTQVDHRAGHGRVTALVGRNGVALGQTQQLCNRLGVDEVTRIYVPDH